MVMNFQQGITREQLSMLCLDQEIDANSAVRLIDLFVDQLDLGKLAFTKTQAAKEGRPPYAAKDMLKLYYYGYLNRVRSSRKLQAECERNIEVWWLINQLKPCYHTIANFRKDNSAALKKAFKMFVSFLKGEEMFDAEVIAIDGTKLRAQNNKKNNFNEAKIKKHLEYIEGKTGQYIKELEDNDAAEDRQTAELKNKEVAKKIDILQQRTKRYKDLQQQLDESKSAQISTVDADSRSLPLKDGITDVCYNVQTAGDSKNNLIVDFDTINQGDQGQLHPMAAKAMNILEVKQITALTDKGYHTGKQLQLCKEQGITTLCAYPERTNKNIDPAYHTDKFMYDAIQDRYTCPQGAVLTTNGKEYEKTKTGRAGYLVKKYFTMQCKTCPVKHLCTTARGIRLIERSEYQQAIDENNKRADENKELCKKRSPIIEHPYGTIKRGWGYSYTLLKGIKKVNGEMAIIFTVYNLRRVISILGVPELLKRLKQWKPALLILKTTLLRALFSNYKNEMCMRA